jgi:tetratricopeptide (TPR) repeat protein
MPRSLVHLAIFAALIVCANAAQADHRQRLYRGGIAYNDYGHGRSGGGGYHYHRHDHHGGNFSFRGYSSYRPYYNNWSGNVYLGIGAPYGYSSFSYYNGPLYGGYGYGGIYGANYYPSLNYVDYYLPPVYYPAELAYGPLAMNQFLGVDRNFGLAPLRAPAQAAPRVVERPAVIEAAKPVVKEIDWEARKKADRFIELGDSHFKTQKFHDALLRYRMAIDASPDYAVAHLRHGFSLIANRRYDEAATALTKAFTLDRQIVASGFRIDLLYADNRIARGAHEEGLANAALNEPNNGNLHFVVGMWLIFSGEADRSRKFFEKAKELGVDAGSMAAVARDL